MDFKLLEAEALRLEPEARARLADRLFESLVESDTGTDRTWIDEALARDEEIETGVVQTRPADEVHREARLRLG